MVQVSPTQELNVNWCPWAGNRASPSFTLWPRLLPFKGLPVYVGTSVTTSVHSGPRTISYTYKKVKPSPYVPRNALLLIQTRCSQLWLLVLDISQGHAFVSTWLYMLENTCSIFTSICRSSLEVNFQYIKSAMLPRVFNVQFTYKNFAFSTRIIF